MNIYVGNLSWGVSEEDLRNEFAAFGDVSAVNVIKDKFTGQSRGFGFVEMPAAAQAEAAINALNGKDMQGRALTVNEARNRAEGGGGGGGGGRGPRQNGGRGGGGGTGGGGRGPGGDRGRRY